MAKENCQRQWFYLVRQNKMELETELETKMGTQPLKCCNLSAINVLLAFVSKHPKALPTSSFLIACFAIAYYSPSFPPPQPPLFLY